MTNSLTQNLNINQDSAINSLLDIQVNTIQNPSSDGSFSNLMNNISAKTENAKSNFVSKVAKTNTSSVNQKAFKANKANDTTNTNKKTSLKETIKSDLKSNTQNNDTNKTTSNDSMDFQDENLFVEKQTNSDNQIVTKKENKQEKTQNSTQEVENIDLSDINNSSFVDPSPVLSLDSSSEENVLQNPETPEIDFSQAVSNVVTLLTNSDTQGVKNELDYLFSQAQNLEDMKAIAQNIVSAIENSDLSQDFKDNLSQTLNNLVSSINEKISSENNIEDFSSIIQDIKTNLSELLESVSKNVASQIDNNKSQLMVVLDKLIKDFSSNIDELYSQEETSIKEAISKFVSEVKKQIENSQSEENNNLTDEEFSALIKKVEKFLDTISLQAENKEVQNIDLINLLKEVKTNVEKIDTQKNTLSNIDLNSDEKIQTNLNKLDEIAQIINSKEIFVSQTNENKISLDNIEITPEFKEAINQIAQQLNEVDINKIKNLSNDDKKLLKNMIDAFSENVDLSKEIKPEEIKEQLNVLLESLKQVQKDETLSQNVQAFTSEQAQNTNVLNKKDIEIHSSEQNELNENNENIELTSNSKEGFDFNQENSQQNSKKQEFENNQEISNINQNETPQMEVKAKISSESIKSEIENKVDVEFEENLSKIASLSDIIDEMLLNSDEMLNQSALSVVDEVARLAIDETSSISSNLQENNVANPLLNQTLQMKGAILKQTPSAQTFSNVMSNKIETSNVLSQITDKITQMKDGSQKLTMVLRPFDLGRLQIEISTNRNGLTTNILAQNDEVRNYIEKNIDGLRQQLSEAGINVNNIQIKTAGQDGATNYSGQNNSNQENLNQQENNHNHKQNKEKMNSQMLANEFGYDFHLAKDFSSILSNTLSYLN